MLTISFALFIYSISITAPTDVSASTPLKPALSVAEVSPLFAPTFAPTLLGKIRFEALEKDPGLPENKTGFRISLLEIGAKGNLTKSWSYRFVANAAIEMTPLDFYAEYQVTPKLNARFGQFKAPFGRQETSRTSELALPNRSSLASVAPGRDTGGMIYGELSPWLAYGAGIFNGEGRNLARNINNAFLSVGRVVVTPYGTRADTGESLLNRKPGLSFGFNGGYNVHGDLQDTPEILMGGDMSYLSERFGLIAEWDQARFLPPKTTLLKDYRSTGFYVQPMVVAIRNRWEWVIRYERFDPNTVQSAVKEQRTESVWLGTNLYLDEGRELLQLAYGKNAELEGPEFNNNEIIFQLQVRME